jgi:hypothetical protein
MLGFGNSSVEPLNSITDDDCLFVSKTQTLFWKFHSKVQSDISANLHR